MSKQDDGAPAFPAESFSAQYAPGMSLRDWFAGQVLNGFASDTNDDALDMRPGDTSDTARRRYWQTIVTTAYEIADFAIAARSTPPA